MKESSLESLLLLSTLFVLHEKTAKALTLLEGLYELAPQDPRILRLLVHVLIAEKHFEQGLEKIRELFDVSRNTMSSEDTLCTLRLQASALWNLNRHEEARAILEQSLMYLPKTYPTNDKQSPTKKSSQIKKTRTPI